MKHMERFEQNSVDQEFAQLTGKKKFETILKLFGTNEARAKFLELCERYLRERQARPVGTDGENYLPGRKKYSPPKRADLHNQIMDVLARIATESKNLSPIQERVLYDLRDRENAALAIKEYILAQRDEEDEDEEERKKQKMSETSYFHSLGKEH